VNQEMALSSAPGVLPACLDREGPGRSHHGDALQLGDGLSRVRFRARLQMAGDLLEKPLDLADALVHVRFIQGWSRYLTIHWTYDTWALANGTGNAIVKSGGDTWFFITADYAFGHALERDTEAVVLKGGGKVLGKVRHPFPGQDFSYFLLQARASKAKIIALANAGGDTINSIKQAGEFIGSDQSLAGLLVFITDVHALGLKTAQGLILTEAWYWDANDGTEPSPRSSPRRTRATCRPWSMPASTRP
jgi:hypothetical protein